MRAAARPNHHLRRRTSERDRAGRTSFGARLAAGHFGADARRASSASEQLPPLFDSERRLTPRSRLVSVQLGNHETGVLQPVAELAAICNRAGVPLHTDAVQVVGKLPVSFRALGVAAMSIAAHKFRGPLGIGALVVRDGVPLAPLMFGGHQQVGLRPGTESVALAVGMATALELWQQEQDEHARRLRSLRDRFEAGLRAALPEHRGSRSRRRERLPQTSNVAFPGLDGQVLLMALDLGRRGLFGRLGLFERLDRAFADASGDGPAQRSGGLVAAIQLRRHDHRGGDRRGRAADRARVPRNSRVTLTCTTEQIGMDPAEPLDQFGSEGVGQLLHFLGFPVETLPARS